MIALVATLVERSRGTDHSLSLSSRDYNAIAGGKGFPFLYQQIKDNINPNQTRLLIHALCRYDERLAGSIIAMLFNAVTKHTEVRISTPPSVENSREVFSAVRSVLQAANAAHRVLIRPVGPSLLLPVGAAESLGRRRVLSTAVARVAGDSSAAQQSRPRLDSLNG